MLGDISIADNIYIVTGYTDMRKSIDGLCAIILKQLQTEPDRNAIYLFCGKMSIPALIEPPVRSLGATLPAAQSHPSGGGNHHSGN